ncbi:MAG: hypothetical protein CXR31_14080 [Geobacter sp.]|nr:MAG: hypothetical protein CXR31_14080 [Geobacter sp.]
MSIENNASKILTFLYTKGTRGFCDGDEVATETGLSPSDINDAIEILESNGYVELLKFLGTAPYRFGQAAITSHGRFAVEQAQSLSDQKTEIQPALKRTPDPIGSPYGFLDEDWEYITEERENSSKLKVVFGYQFKSDHYDSLKLGDNIKQAFINAVNTYNKDPKSIQVLLDFVQLGAGFGEHVFNEIARDIISADIAVFDTSDLNPNVMLEMGVALTWGVRVLPIRSSNCPPPPSDISGQTWAAYKPHSDANEFEDNTFESKLNRMVKRAAQKKVR